MSTLDYIKSNHDKRLEKEVIQSNRLMDYAWLA